MSDYYWVVDLEAEVKRLEGLILDWEGDPPGSAKAIMREAERIRGKKP